MIIGPVKGKSIEYTTKVRRAVMKSVANQLENSIATVLLLIPAEPRLAKPTPTREHTLAIEVEMGIP